MKQIIEELKQIQADSQVFYVKTHNFHWNVKGFDFHQVHVATQEIYEYFADIFDDVAERILQLGGKPYVTLAQIIQAAKIKEEPKTSFVSKEILSAVLADYEYFLGLFTKVSTLSSQGGDVVTQSYADDKISKLQKSIWMLKAQLS